MDERTQDILRIIEKKAPISIDHLYREVVRAGIYRESYWFAKSMRILTEVGKVIIINGRVDLRREMIDE